MANVIFSNAIIKRKNLEGREVRKGRDIVNSEGNRNFLLIIPEDRVQEMFDMGFDVKQFSPDEHGNPGNYYMQVKLGYKIKSPKVWLVTKKANGKSKRTLLDENNLKDIDKLAPSDIINVRLDLRAVKGFDKHGNPVTKAWVNIMYVEIDDMDPFADDYDFDDENDGDECPFE